MVKIIHCIKIGNQLGDFELSCINSWKATYPDFEIRFWTDREILPLIQDCKFAVYHYEHNNYAFVTDYARLKILYEMGGLYVDTDVFCVERVPDNIFDKSFTAWDAGFSTYWTQSGTCLYAASPNEPIFKEFIDLYKSFEEDKFVDNTVVEQVIRRHGLNFLDRINCQFSSQGLDSINVYNCVQMGAFDYNQNLLWEANVPIYLVHSRTKSWQNNKQNNIYLFYLFIEESTDKNLIYEAISNYKENPNFNQVLVLGLNCISYDKVNWFSKYLKMNNINYLVAPLGNNLSKEELNSAFLDFVSKRFDKVKFCKNILGGIK